MPPVCQQSQSTEPHNSALLTDLVIISVVDPAAADTDGQGRAPG